MANSGQTPPPAHVGLFPSAGMGHLTPFLRLAASLVNQNIQVTFITVHPNVSLAESQFISDLLATFPQIIPKQFHLLPFDPSTANSNDPFFLQFEAIRRSAPLLSPLIASSSPPLSALVTDITLASSFLPITSSLGLPNYILFTSSAKMLSFCTRFPSLVDTGIDQQIHIPGLSPIPKSWVPPILLDFTTLFATQFVENGNAMKQANGILINTFESFERESLKALNEGKVHNGLPPVVAIGPLPPRENESESNKSFVMQWLDKQPEDSVVYVSFGSRTAMSREQIRELGEGLVRSGCRFVWVVKDKKVDREDQEGVEEIVGNGFVEKVKDKGLVIKTWVNQEEVLGHRAVGGFVSHCGWNSVTEAAWHGVRILAWPLGGDQKINAHVIRTCGLGMWVENWGWGGEKVVGGEEIGVKIRELMNDQSLRLQAAHVREEARGAVQTSQDALVKLFSQIFSRPFQPYLVEHLTLSGSSKLIAQLVDTKYSIREVTSSNPIDEWYCWNFRTKLCERAQELQTEVRS